MSKQAFTENRIYFPALDGLRGISFLLVFLFHCHIPLFNIGWGGVIIFFVISGFLITDILLNQEKQSGFFVKFFTKRLLRITPIYILVLISSSIIFLILNHKFPNNFIFYLFNIQNFLQVFNQTLVDLNGYLAHTWTLAIEEQFYLIYPFIIFFSPKKKMVWILIALILITFIYRSYATVIFSNPLAISTMLISQTDSLALGCLLAFIRKEHFNKKKFVEYFIQLSAPIGGIGLCAIIIFLSNHYEVSLASAYKLLNQPENYLIHPFTSQIYFFIALIAFGTISHLITSPQSKFSKLLSSKVLVHFGLISYGMYLYHWPILGLLKRITADILLITFIGMGLTYICFTTILYYNREILSLE